MVRRFVALAGAFGLVSACFASGPPSGAPDAAADSGPTVTYYKDIVPIVQQHCQACHQPGGIAPFSLIDYASAAANAATMVSDTQQRIMPPWGAQATSECQLTRPWKDDLRLSQQQLDTIKAWNDQGAVAGNPADAPPPVTIPLSNDLPGATNLAPSTPFTLTQSSDYFRCYVLDPMITTSGTFITGTNVKPGNKTIVHHALLFSVPANATIPAPTDGVPNQYSCFGGPGVTGASLVGLWAPGGLPYQYPANVGQPLAAGTKFIMQVHYHPHANATPDPDTTTFQFTTTTTSPTWSVLPVLIGNYTNGVTNGTGLENPPFLIPPNTPSQVYTMDTTVPSSKVPIAVRLLSVVAHMHLVGVDEKITIDRASPDANDPAEECLLQVPQWSFNWQRAYQYDTDIPSLPLVSPGDDVKLRCTYDNTMQNPALAAALTEAGMSQTQPVTIGETTMDEMCLGAFWLVYPTL